jgi:AcrR family transcriptional regulator
MTMEQKSRAVNTRRRYDSSGRRERARQTRDQIIDVARELFVTNGYAGTTVTAIAVAAHVSVETIYKSFGGKPGLVRAIVDKGLAGEGPIPAEQRSDRIRDSEPDPRRILIAWGSFVTELAPRTVPVLALARNAASDPEVGVLLGEISAARHERMTLNARRLADAGHLRPGVPISEAADILWAYSSPELYELLALQRGWSAEQYGCFVGQALIAALLPPARPDGNGPDSE